MTRTGAGKPVDLSAWRGRLDNARAYHRSAADGLALMERSGNANPIMSDVVLAAIAYTDALTAAFGGRVNQKDHAAAAKTLRDVLGNRVPKGQLTRLSSMLAEKDAVQYGARFGRFQDAEAMLADLDAFAAWAEQELRRLAG